MKKLVSMLACCLVASAEASLAAMTTEELVELHKAVDAEIDARIGYEQEAVCDGLSER